ncbi:MAG: hypothetical protein HRU82_01565 [Nitrospira sp.]|nr:MAG: hypothetical protein HRU82_01565 [Nitrospira sp.]
MPWPCRRVFQLAERSGKAVWPPIPTVPVNNVRTGFLEEDEFRLLL